MKSIEKITEHTLVIKKSEFICTLIPLNDEEKICLLYTSPSPRDAHESRMPSSA